MSGISQLRSQPFSFAKAIYGAADELFRKDKGAEEKSRVISANFSSSAEDNL